MTHLKKEGMYSIMLIGIKDDFLRVTEKQRSMLGKGIMVMVMTTVIATNIYLVLTYGQGVMLSNLIFSFFSSRQAKFLTVLSRHN